MEKKPIGKEEDRKNGRRIRKIRERKNKPKGTKERNNEQTDEQRERKKKTKEQITKLENLATKLLRRRVQ